MVEIIRPSLLGCLSVGAAGIAGCALCSEGLLFVAVCRGASECRFCSSVVSTGLSAARDSG